MIYLLKFLCCYCLLPDSIRPFEVVAAAVVEVVVVAAAVEIVSAAVEVVAAVGVVVAVGIKLYRNKYA